MADETNLVNSWFTANPNATQADAAKAVQSIGGLTPDLASALATHYGTSADVVNNAYTQLTAPTPTPTPTPTPSPTPSASSPLQYDAFTTANPGGVGTSYGQAPITLIQSVQKSNPDLVSSLANGTAQYNSNPDGSDYLIDTTTGQRIGGDYTITTTPDNKTVINIPTNNGAMIQAVTSNQADSNGMLAPVTENNVFNVGLNRGAGGFAGGLSDPINAFSVPLAMLPVTAPFLAAYNVGNDISNGRINTNTFLNALNAYTGFGGPTGGVDPKLLNNVKSGLGVVNAVTSKNPLGLANSVLNLASNNDVGVDPNIQTALNATALAKNIASNNIPGIINSALATNTSANTASEISANDQLLDSKLSSNSPLASTGNEYDIFNHDPNMVNASLSLAKPPGSQDTQTMNMYDQINKALSLTRAPDNAIISDLKTIFSESGDLDEDGNPILDKTTQVVVKVPIGNGKFSGYTINYDPQTKSVTYEYFTPFDESGIRGGTITSSKNPPIYDPETNKFLPPTKEPIADNTSQQTLPTDNR